MDNKTIRHLRRRDLLEMLLDLSRENAQLKERIDELEGQLQDRTIMIDEAGSLAEAVCQINDVFKAAQNACDQYIYNTQQRCRQMEELAKQQCMQLIAETKGYRNSYEQENCEEQTNH